jgi:hypothetical protein
MIPTDDTVYAIKISPTGAARLCAAAGIAPPDWEDREWAEIDVQRETQSLAGRKLDEIISEDDIVSRRPFRCTICGEPFTIDQFDRLRRLHRERGKPRPFDSVDPIHEACSPA